MMTLLWAEVMPPSECGYQWSPGWVAVLRHLMNGKLSPSHRDPHLARSAFFWSTVHSRTGPTAG
jgi:hypothetical protein